MINQWHVNFNFHFSVAGMHYVSATQPGLWTCHDLQRDRPTPLPVRIRRKRWPCRKRWPRFNFPPGTGNGLNASFRYRPGWRPGLLVWYGVSKLNDATMISSKMNMMISCEIHRKKEIALQLQLLLLQGIPSGQDWGQLGTKDQISPFERGRVRPGIGSQIDPSF